MLAILITPRLYNPEIVVPAAQIIVVRPGNGPEQILAQVVTPLEELMASLKGVKHTYGYAVNDMGVVMVEFEVGADEIASLMYLYNELQRNMDRLPPGTRLPLVKSMGINDVPILAVTLSSGQLFGNPSCDRSPSGFSTSSTAFPTPGQPGDRDRARSGQDPGGSAAPGRHRHLSRPAARGPQGVQCRASGRPPGGPTTSGSRSAWTPPSVRWSDLGDIVIGRRQRTAPSCCGRWRPSSAGPRTSEMHAWLAFGRGQQARAGRRPGQCRHHRHRQTPGQEFGDGGPRPFWTSSTPSKREALPEGVKVTVTRNYGQRANEAVNTLIEHLGIALLAVLVILLFFLGWREASIVTILVPLTLFVVLGVGMIMGQTINRITLFALILSLGLLVDDGIVVIENIHRHIHRAHTIRDFGSLIVNATNEIGNPTIMATFTVIVAFIPMLFVTGMMGPFMRPIPINVPVAMITSLMLADIVVPYIALRWLRSKAARRRRRWNAPPWKKTDRPSGTFCGGFTWPSFCRCRRAPSNATSFSPWWCCFWSAPC